MSCHLASDRSGVKLLKQAVNEFADFLFDEFPWCKMIFAKPNKSSLERLLLKTGFKKVYTFDDCEVYARSKSWEK